MELSNFNKKLEGLQNLIINNNDIDGLHGDGKELVDNEDFPITHDFSDQLYMRKMLMKKAPRRSPVIQGSIRTEGSTMQASSEKDFGYYQNLRRENSSLYYKPSTQSPQASTRPGFRRDVVSSQS